MSEPALVSSVAVACKSCDQAVVLQAQVLGETVCPRRRHRYVCDDGILLLGRSWGPDDYPAELHELLTDVEPRHFRFGAQPSHPLLSRPPLPFGVSLVAISVRQ